ncbi:hypothetical protein RRG08_039705 [Elysia crispata]|uniref:Uncharacterized protein n=1 Tax=Elysia crispata TaxID=231223 RepID=A0AAE0YA00_9GAST|nr:hypothetical protein RRG08_039705 [Elysia crispata]
MGHKSWTTKGFQVCLRLNSNCRLLCSLSRPHCRITMGHKSWTTKGFQVCLRLNSNCRLLCSLSRPHCRITMGHKSWTTKGFQVCLRLNSNCRLLYSLSRPHCRITMGHKSWTTKGFQVCLRLNSNCPRPSLYTARTLETLEHEITGLVMQHAVCCSSPALSARCDLRPASLLGEVCTLYYSTL